MGKLFSKPPTPGGLSKSRIIWAGSIIVITLSGAVLFGVFSADKEPSQHLDNTNQYNNTHDSKLSLEQILNKVKHVKDSATISSAPVITARLPESTMADVPPIVDSDDKEFRQHLVRARHGYELKQADGKYTSLSSKTLMFSSISHKHNASDTSTSIDKSGDKEFFSKSAPDKTVVNASSDSRIIVSQSIYELKAGSVIPATMINGINSDLPGQVVAQVRDNIYNTTTRQYLLIPQGAKLVGVYDSKIVYGQERLLVAWNRVIYPNGNSINLKAMPGTDLEGYAGFSDEVDNKYWRIFGASFIMGVITAGMQYSQNNTNAEVQSGGMGFTNTNPTIGQTVAGSLGQQLGQTGLMVTQKNLNIQPTLIVKPGYPFNIMITADLALEPYVYAR